MNSKSDNLKCAAIFLVIFLSIFIPIQLNRTNEVDTTLNEQLKFRVALLETLQSEQAKIITDLKINLTDHEKRIVINFDKMNKNTSEIINNKIDIDGISYEGLQTQFEEVYREIEIMKKKVK